MEKKGSQPKLLILKSSKLINGEKGISTKIINLKIIKTLAESMDFSNYRQIGL